jgi:predicted kinase
VAEQPDRRARVNRDDLRTMLHEGLWRGSDTEGQVVAARDAVISSLLRAGTDVVSDDTNLGRTAVRDLKRLAASVGATVEVWDLTDVPVDLCVVRDGGRAHPVGEAAIRSMYARYIAPAL